MLSFIGRKPAKNLPATLSLFPLGTTLFPGGRLGLKVFEQRYIELAKGRIADGELFGVVTLTDGGEVGAEQTFATVGTAARVLSFDMPQAGIFLLDVAGEDRFEVLHTKTEKSGLQQATVRWIPAEKKVKLPQTYAELGVILSQIMVQAGDSRFAEPFDLEDATWVGSRLVEILQLPPSIKQNLLEINDAELRLKTVYHLINRATNASAPQAS
ncbi:MAG: LON peptidase substrate-binding domain-containing protein [Rhizobacter sp.]|nr:LON peptidase substrate-binding domain-containing protein [Burkholderiales bacterium]